MSTSFLSEFTEKATDGSLQSEDWTLNMEICDIINETEEGRAVSCCAVDVVYFDLVHVDGRRVCFQPPAPADKLRQIPVPAWLTWMGVTRPKDAIRALKKRLNGNRNYREVMLALTVLETCVKNCGHRFHVLVANRDFIDSVLVKTISPKNNPPTIVQDKVLALIQAWADAFRSSPDLTGVVHTYEELKRKGVEFPTADLDALSPIHTPQRSVPEVDPAATMPRSQSQPKTSAGSYSAPQAPALSVSGPITANSEQIARLRSELDVVRGNTKVMSEMLTEMVPGQEDSSDLELLQELHRTCRAMQQRIVELISRVCNEEVTEELLHVNDDLNNVFLRYESPGTPSQGCRLVAAVLAFQMLASGALEGDLAKAATTLGFSQLRLRRLGWVAGVCLMDEETSVFERYRSGRSAQNASNGALSEVAEDNLIDLGPGSPAVVSPAVGSTAPPSSLSSQLAGLEFHPAWVALHHIRSTFVPATPPHPRSLVTDLGTESVSGTLSSLQQCDPRDSFDMFAQTRGSSLAEQRKTATYEDPQAVGGLASALDSRKQSSEVVPVAQPSVMDDIEVWLRTDLRGDDLEEGVTSEEFDKFLEERAKAAEMVPNLPSPPAEAPAPASNPSGRKKPERSEDALFAL
ncbi:TOM1-like protein 2 [Camelus dromedarius]|uniref:TOM1-like protein 2 n=1 Tax=Camelus dromedarius TaxID=9838 RepID=A0A5N4D2J6_CAMDR|nr:TOM1-like protein 2 [Camelus dromedarius]